MRKKQRRAAKENEYANNIHNQSRASWERNSMEDQYAKFVQQWTTYISFSLSSAGLFSLLVSFSQPNNFFKEVGQGRKRCDTWEKRQKQLYTHIHIYIIYVCIEIYIYIHETLAHRERNNTQTNVDAVKRDVA